MQIAGSMGAYVYDSRIKRKKKVKEIRFFMCGLRNELDFMWLGKILKGIY